VVTFTDFTISTTQDNLARRAERHAEAQERPRWCVDADWQAAKEAARASGYTGHAVYRAAADALSERYGYR